MIYTAISCMNCYMPIAVKEGYPLTFTKHCPICGALCGYTTTSKNINDIGVEMYTE